MNYCRPEVRDYGDLVAITADGVVMAQLGIGTLAAASSPLVPSAGVPSAGGVVGDGATFPDVGDVAGAGGDLDPVADTGGPADSGGSGGGGGSGGSGGGELPFTGFAAAAVAAIGAGLSAGGATLKKYLSRG